MKYPTVDYTQVTIWQRQTVKDAMDAPPAAMVWEVLLSLIRSMSVVSPRDYSNRVNQLLAGPLELHVVDGIILPNLKMTGTEEACSFLDSDGCCSIHAFRPGICRMFPLGRFYEDHAFKYFLQIHECPKTDRTKVKIKKWLDTPNLKTYETYISDWHFFLKDLQDYVMKLTSDQTQTDSDNTAKTISMHVLTQFYLTPYQPDGNFYDEFYARLEKSRLFTSSLHI